MPIYLSLSSSLIILENTRVTAGGKPGVGQRLLGFQYRYMILARIRALLADECAGTLWVTFGSHIKMAIWRRASYLTRS